MNDNTNIPCLNLTARNLDCFEQAVLHFLDYLEDHGARDYGAEQANSLSRVYAEALAAINDAWVDYAAEQGS